jgi:hypothetical protein
MKRIVFGLAIAGAFAAATVTSASAGGWGCGARSRLNWGASFNAPSEAFARKVALYQCRDNDCVIIGCRSNVDQAQANALWQPSGSLLTRGKGAQ